MLVLFSHLIQVVPLGGTVRKAPILMHACTVFVCVTVQMLVYPNQLDVPLMENSGLPKAPVGMLEVTVEKATGLKGNDVLGKGDPYLRLQVQVCPRCHCTFFFFSSILKLATRFPQLQRRAGISQTLQGQACGGNVLKSTIIRAEHERFDKDVANTEASCFSVACTLPQLTATALTSTTSLASSVKAFWILSLQSGLNR
jgi:hypothetical protein